MYYSALLLIHNLLPPFVPALLRKLLGGGGDFSRSASLKPSTADGEGRIRRPFISYATLRLTGVELM